MYLISNIMRLKNYYLVLGVLVAIVLLFACRKKDSDPQGNDWGPYNPTPYTIDVPEGFPEPVIPEFNKMTVEGVNLGRYLYYDNILSSNGLSCNSCHIRSLSFSKQLFVTLAGETKSIPPHVNLAWNPDFNWTGSEPVLDNLCLGDFEPEFFNTNKDSLFSRLSKSSIYPEKFYKAFGIEDINKLSYAELKQKIVYAISQFMRTMVSSNSKYNKFIHHQAMMTPSEIRGFNIFFTEKGDCFHCHGGDLTTDNSFHNTGLDANPTSFNMGRYNYTGNPNDIGKFSTPTLINIELTAPYMHDGRFQTLEEVIEFYNSGVHNTSPNIDPIMTKPGKEYGLGLTPMEKADLLNFLKTFTDTSFINNPAYFNPL